MRLPRKSEYPKELDIPCKDGTIQTYEIKWARKFKDRMQMAECDPGAHEITIKLGQTPTETFRCFIHEILHAIEFEMHIDIKHSMIYKLEEALFHLLKLNV